MLLNAEGLRKSYARGNQRVDALRDVSVSAAAGEFIAVMGPSGSGKSTLLQLVGGLDTPCAGTVRIAGHLLRELNDDRLSEFRRRRIGFIFQFFNLLPTLTALENVALPLLLDGRSFESVAARAQEHLDRLGLADRARHLPDQLSGGEMQRVAIARALITDPCLILADEPTGNLDSQAAGTVLAILRRIAVEDGKAVVMVTHDAHAASFATRTIRFRDGSIASDTLATC